ncbi:MAG: hypothetical protein ACOC2H_04460 [Spirochaetota bacterium]
MKIISRILLIITVFASVLLFAQDFGVSDMLQKPLSYDRLQMMPVTKDFRNYFVFQSIEDQSNILIGDFVGAEKKIILVIDNEADNNVDRVMEYYPDSQKRKSPKTPNSDLYSSLEQMKKDIISGKIFDETYSYKMRSLGSLTDKLKEGSDIVKSGHGYLVRLYDPDKPSTIMSEFFFGRKDGRYDLIFITRYYKLYHTVISPPVYYSVYCRSSNDPVVKETVENLIKLVE